ncbi:MAG TPA: 4Fe-4S dicluster domain-containing protein [Candidatus Acidoferrales bacterium]|jgi:formate dehydrogenase iron-sulfur subunit|nr:4Fe-4S dicluster domain-containing protein [Candidatus Acidoferrales bacterium]
MTITAFLTDSTLCIGCKACEVACKEWNGIKADGFQWTGKSYDNTLALGHSTWRHVKFVEGEIDAGRGGNAPGELSWEFSSDVCKHCENAGCLEACPTGAIVRTEFGGVYIQPDVCNGCAYCVVACPFGVVERNEADGRAFKCTFCYDRQKDGLKPACATACPTESIKFGNLDDLRQEGRERVEKLKAKGLADVEIYDPVDSSVGGIHAFFIVRGDPKAYNLPPKPEIPTVYLRKGWTSAAVAAGMMLGGALLAFLGGGRGR